MDGVITNSMPEHFRAWRKIFSEEGILVSHLDVYAREGQPGKNTVRELFKTYGKPYTPAIAKAILEKKERLFKTIVKRRFIPGARRFLKGLADKGFTLALVTGTSKHEAKRILPGHIWGLFSVIITGDDVRRGKPFPEPFLKALKKLSLKPDKAIVIENAPFGIESAKRAGLKCIALATSLPKSYLKGADLVFPSFKELQKKVSFLAR
jgi:beta-phosphoglucomutase